MTRPWWLLAMVVVFVPTFALEPSRGGEPSQAGPYRALRCPTPTGGTTWAILSRDGANREVTPYLSSLGQGESGVGVITSPPFVVGTDEIRFTIRGHDGQGGGSGQNYIALVDARKGNTLVSQPAPGNDALQPGQWDVRAWRGTEVRVEVHDGDRGTAFAWLGIGEIDAGPALHVDFRQGMPAGWTERAGQRTEAEQFELVSGTIPFRRSKSVYSLIPPSGSVEIPCGFAARRLFLLGCTVARGAPLDVPAGVEIHYQDGSCDLLPLMIGFTLDGQYKLASPSPALRLLPSGDPYQQVLVIVPRQSVIGQLRLVAQPDRMPIPRITAITCETDQNSELLDPLPSSDRMPAELDALAARGVVPGRLDWEQIVAEICRAHHLASPLDARRTVRFRKHTLDRAFRSEGVAVGDFNQDKLLDIAAGNTIYTAPQWQPHPLFGQLRKFARIGYSDAFLCFADDLDRDGSSDLVVVGFPGRQTRWLRNPGQKGGNWSAHLAVEQTGNESPYYGDLDGDGKPELVFMDGPRLVAAAPGPDPRQPWTIRHLGAPGDPAPGHGLGVGDVNGDGRLDVLIGGGWWEGPPRSDQLPWRFHGAPLFGEAQLCVYDLDGDGDNDVLGSSAHGYGIAWCEQTADGWIKHDIDDTISQTHALHVVDINADGLIDFVTGKRFWAHNGKDPGSFQPALLCWYEQHRSSENVSWVRHVIDMDSGVGLHVQVLDMNGDQRPDIVTSNKNGVYYFEQLGAATSED